MTPVCSRGEDLLPYNPAFLDLLSEYTFPDLNAGITAPAGGLGVIRTWHRRYRYTLFTLLCFADPCVFHKLKVCGDPASSKSIGPISLTAFTHFMSLCHHIVVILTIFQTFSLSYFLCDQ